MAEDYIAKFKEQESESSSLSDEDLKEAVTKTGIPVDVLEEAKAKAETGPEVAAPSIPFVGIGEKKKETEFKPYTVSIENLLQEPKKVPENKPDDVFKDPLYELASQYSDIGKPQNKIKSDNLTQLGNYYSKDTSNRTEAPIQSRPYFSKPTPSYKPTQSYNYKVPSSTDLSIISEDPAVARGSQDYKDFEREFSKNKMSQKEIDNMSKRLEQRYHRLQEFARELEGGEGDPLLFRNKLIRELSDIQNDLKEANSNVLVLMNDRAGMKDAFCLLQVKLKKVNSLNKTMQEGINGRELAFQKLTNTYNDLKEDMDRTRNDLERYKVINFLLELIENFR